MNKEEQAELVIIATAIISAGMIASPMYQRRYPYDAIKEILEDSYNMANTIMGRTCEEYDVD